MKYKRCKSSDSITFAIPVDEPKHKFVNLKDNINVHAGPKTTSGWIFDLIHLTFGKDVLFKDKSFSGW